MTPKSLRFSALFASLLALLSACNSAADPNAAAPAMTVAPSQPAIAASAAAPAPPTTAPITYEEAGRIRTSLEYLASDALEGRGLNTDGLDKAAEFVAREFKDAGLQPLPALDGYFQPFSTVVSTNLGDDTNLTVNGTALKLKDNFTALGSSAEGAFAGPLAFVGYGISSDEFEYDDYAGIDVTDKVVLMLRYEPHDEDGDSRFEKDGWSSEASLITKARAAIDRGAAAVLLVNPPVHHAGDRLISFSRNLGERTSIPMLMITIEQANAILEKAGVENLETLQKKIDSTGQPHSFALDDVAASGEVQIARVEKTIRNIAGYLPGSGAKADEFIVIGAHYDHLGKGERGSISRSGEIHNGADDNGSGTVALIELARKLAKQRAALERSVVFVAFTGEERGLIGSSHFVKNPPIPLDKVVAMVNLDMVGRIVNDTIFIGGTGTAMPFERIVEQADARSPLSVKVAGALVGGKGGMGPSDHESFALKKVPVIFFYSGMHPDYHRPTDDVEKINFIGIAQVVDMCADVVAQLDDMPPAQYVDTHDRTFGNARSRGSGGSNVQLGIMPDYNESQPQPGVRVAGTVPDTAAAKAGIKEGDIIIGIGDAKITGLGDYMSALAKHKPGQTVKIKVIRDNQEVELDATLQERRG